MTCPARRFALVFIECVKLLAVIVCGIAVIVGGYSAWLLWCAESWVREVGKEDHRRPDRGANP